MENNFFFTSKPRAYFMTKKGKPAWFCRPVNAKITITVTPYYDVILNGDSAQFTATVNNADSNIVIWCVNGIPGGNKTVGTIDNNGYYTSYNDHTLDQLQCYPNTYPITAELASNHSVVSAPSYAFPYYGYFNLQDKCDSVYNEQIYHITRDFKINIWNAPLYTDIYWCDLPIETTYDNINILVHQKYVFLVFTSPYRVFYKVTQSNDSWTELTIPFINGNGITNVLSSFLNYGSDSLYQWGTYTLDSSSAFIVVGYDSNTDSVVSVWMTLNDLNWSSIQSIYNGDGTNPVNPQIKKGGNVEVPTICDTVGQFICYQFYDTAYGWSSLGIANIPYYDTTKPYGISNGQSGRQVFWGFDLNTDLPSTWFLDTPQLYPTPYFGNNAIFTSVLSYLFSNEPCILSLSENTDNTENASSMLLVLEQDNVWINTDDPTLYDTVTINYNINQGGSLDYVDNVMWSFNESWSIVGQQDNGLGGSVTIQRQNYDNIGYDATFTYNLTCPNLNTYYGLDALVIIGETLMWSGLEPSLKEGLPSGSSYWDGNTYFTSCLTVLDESHNFELYSYANTVGLVYSLPNRYVGKLCDGYMRMNVDDSIMQYSPLADNDGYFTITATPSVTIPEFDINGNQIEPVVVTFQINRFNYTLPITITSGYLGRLAQDYVNGIYVTRYRLDGSLGGQVFTDQGEYITIENAPDTFTLSVSGSKASWVYFNYYWDNIGLNGKGSDGFIAQSNIFGIRVS